MDFGSLGRWRPLDHFKLHSLWNGTNIAELGDAQSPDFACTLGHDSHDLEMDNRTGLNYTFYDMGSICGLIAA